MIICSSGNDTDNLDAIGAIKRYPACIDSEKIIVVGNSTIYDSMASDTNYGKQSVDIFAPGESILTCYPVSACINETHDTLYTVHQSNGYHYLSGSSLATPYVAGVAALIMSAHPTISPTQMRDVILDSVDVCTGLQNYCATDGRLNAYSAVRALKHYNYTDNGNTHSGVCSCGQTITGAAHVYKQIGTVMRCKYCAHQVQLQNIDPEHEIE